MTVKRIFDLAMAIPALIVLSPLLIVVSIWIKIDSSGPIIYRQIRIGRGGVPFDILKFRTMIVRKTDDDLLITRTTDERITNCGKIFRKLKIDEIPQLVNVVRGHMSFVGPRPEVKKYVDMYPDSVREKILSVRPGITDNASIFFHNEGDLLAISGDPERDYVEKILPKKLRMYEEYVDKQSLLGDLILILKTVFKIIS